MSAVRVDPWQSLRALTPARIALGRSGASLPTAELLRFQLAHAQARDAVHTPFDADALAAEVGALGFVSAVVSSAATERGIYLQRPDLGRRLADESRALLRSLAAAPGSVVFVAGDGLSAQAVQRHAPSVLRELRPLLEADGFAIGPVVVARGARVALGDEIGAALAAQAVLVTIGERPGLSSPDSLGAYLSWTPRVGSTDAQRNCVSNIRPAGLSCAEAARKLAWLLHAARALGATGVALKDESASDAVAAAAPPALRG